MIKKLSFVTLIGTSVLLGDNFTDLGTVKPAAVAPTQQDAHSTTGASSHVGAPLSFHPNDNSHGATMTNETKKIVVDVEPNSELGQLVKDLKKELAELKAERAKEKVAKALAAKKAKELAKKKALAAKKAKELAKKKALAAKKPKDEHEAAPKGDEVGGMEGNRVPKLEEPCDDKLLPPAPKAEAKKEDAHGKKEDAHAEDKVEKTETKKADAHGKKEDAHAPAAKH